MDINKKKMTGDKRKQMILTEGYNLINRVKLWYQMIWTFWSRDQATHNKDDTTPEKLRNQVWWGCDTMKTCLEAPTLLE